MPSLRNVHSRLVALEARLPALDLANESLTPAQQAELIARLAAIKVATGEDLTPVLERHALARSTADRETVMRSCTDRDLHLLLVLRGEALDDERDTSGAFTDEERAAIAAACAGWGQLEHGKE